MEQSSPRARCRSCRWRGHRARASRPRFLRPHPRSLRGRSHTDAPSGVVGSAHAQAGHGARVELIVRYPHLLFGVASRRVALRRLLARVSQPSVTQLSLQRRAWKRATQRQARVRLSTLHHARNATPTHARAHLRLQRGGLHLEILEAIVPFQTVGSHSAAHHRHASVSLADVVQTGWRGWEQSAEAPAHRLIRRRCPYLSRPPARPRPSAVLGARKRGRGARRAPGGSDTAVPRDECTRFIP